MGRYYNGDIEGKFWFAVQSSDDADNFGVKGEAPDELEYNFDEEDLNGVIQGIEECIKGLGKFKGKLDKFFEKHNSYNEKMLVKEFKATEEEVKRMLMLYARLELGLKIKECIKQNGYCNFTAEC